MAHLRDHPPVRSQFRSPRRLYLSPLRGELTGCTVIHTAENILDIIGADEGAEGVLRYIRVRSDPGSYHDLVDSDSNIQLVDYDDEAYQDGTGSNPWALSIAFACKAADWSRMSTWRRQAFLRQGAIAFARQQRWLTAHGYRGTPLRRITKIQSAAGHPGFIGHGTRDPGRRSDPGVDFPWDEWYDFCAEATRGPAPTEETVMFIVDDPASNAPESDRKWLCDAQTRRHIGWEEYLGLKRLKVLELNESAPAAERSGLLAGRKEVSA